MTSRGLTANRYPSRVERLRRYMRMIVDETRKLQKAHGSSRVHLVDVKDLSDVGPRILKQLGAKNSICECGPHADELVSVRQPKRPDLLSLQALPLRPSHQNRGTDLFHTLVCAVMSHHALAVLAPPSCICCFGSGC